MMEPYCVASTIDQAQQFKEWNAMRQSAVHFEPIHVSYQMLSILCVSAKQVQHNYAVCNWYSEDGVLGLVQVTRFRPAHTNTQSHWRRLQNTHTHTQTTRRRCTSWKNDNLRNLQYHQNAIFIIVISHTIRDACDENENSPRMDGCFSQWATFVILPHVLKSNRIWNVRWLYLLFH